ncbi:predicted protein [Sclerotinia sclerotiorum 1980 UF-70]|uniref:Uncharacterized protein n=2 Tax=Sclerotinia sclerotiorum (strain ATCC 18683 / 1980 / Ss-1) TaxID=665079 RepID=A7E7P1_SCLS1|nr:predicted protein [Sclerotinia sclerotiorum 1980 UF-70]APA06201.1 hypothetical protein sscle_01g009710 [Sclerotinia sclerotiorum 1980 UF-70]EDN96393.1 predicted protein [Sclerotinia sclerotiorum 1980 UF-70]
MTKKLGLQAFLRREVIKAKLQVPEENEIPSLSKKNSMPISQHGTYEEPEKNTFRDIFGDGEEDYESPMERLKSSKMPLPFKNELKPKTEVRLRIEELRKQLIAVIDTSFKGLSERAIIARERDHLLRSIERLEAQERREKDNARRATGNVPEPVSEFKKRQQQKEIELVKKALAGEEKIKSSTKRSTRELDDDPDGETRKMLGLPLKRRKLEKTGKWTDDLLHAIPQLRCKDYGVEELKGILLCGATEDQKEWLWKWFSKLDAKVTTNGRVRGHGKKRSL